jgi:hypothetical protein
MGRILFGTCDKATGRIRFDRTPDRGAAATILPRAQPIRGNLLGFVRAHGKPVMIAEAAPQGYGLVERTYGSPSSTGRSLADETRQATGHDWCEPFCDPIRANTDINSAVPYINADWNDQPMWQAGGTYGCRGDSRVQANAYLKARWSNEIDTAFCLHGSDQLFGRPPFEGRQVTASSVFEFL